jgi:hypothetical protein
MPTDDERCGGRDYYSGGAGRVHAESARWFVAFGGVQFTVSRACPDSCDAARVPAAVLTRLSSGLPKGQMHACMDNVLARLLAPLWTAVQYLASVVRCSCHIYHHTRT